MASASAATEQFAVFRPLSESILFVFFPARLLMRLHMDFESLTQPLLVTRLLFLTECPDVLRRGDPKGHVGGGAISLQQGLKVEALQNGS